MKRNILLLLLVLTSSFAYAQEESEPEFIDYFFTKQNGDTIKGSVSLDYKVVYLNLITARAIGEKVVLNIDEETEYFYKKSFLAKGNAVKFMVKKDIQKIKFTIYNPNKKKHLKRKKKQESSMEATDAKVSD